MRKTLCFLPFIIFLSACADLSANIYADPLAQWLTEHPDFRLAVAKDCACEFVIEHNKREVGKRYDPYRVEGDFDGDKKSDLAVVVVNKKAPDDFLILVFASHLASGLKPVVYGNILFDKNLGGLGIATQLYKGRTLLLFGTLNAEGAVVLHIPVQVPNN
jgi:hypothetical protein